MAQITQPCATCTREYRGDSRGRYCSPECKAEAGRRRAAAWYAEHGQDPNFRDRVRASTRRHYEKVIADPELKSARLAATAAWRAANPERMNAQNREWRAANRERKREKDRRRRARLLAAFVADVDADAIWDRDKGLCGICSELIDPELPWPNKMCKTLDHITPLAKGGTHEPANVQLAHAVCNSRKNDRLDYALPLTS